ncbi:N-acetylgalactosamine kinase, partial [Stegodyphus mimosarum]
MTVVIKDVLESKCYSKPELCSILEISDFEFTSLLTKNTLHMEEFQLAQRAEHVFQEATRVMNFKSVCENSSGDKIHELGRLMNESHESCRDLYDCSHPDLDELVRISLEAGAKGSRLTGAGWGGCCVSLVMENQVDEFLNAVKRNFYGKKALSQTIDVETVMFLSKPSGGAVIYIVDNYAV